MCRRVGKMRKLLLRVVVRMVQRLPLTAGARIAVVVAVAAVVAAAAAAAAR
jgi:hypothetical protein